MKMMQDGKDAEKGEQIDAEEGEARAWFKENRESSSLTADDGTELAAWYYAASESTHDYAVCLHGYTNEPIGMAPIRQAIPRPRHERTRTRRPRPRAFRR